MKLSIRNIMGCLTTTCILLAILRRPLAYVLEGLFNFSEWEHVGQAIAQPYYIDIYLLGLDEYWYKESFDKVIGGRPPKDFSSGVLIIIEMLSILFSFCLHLFLFFVLGHYLTYIFSNPPTKIWSKDEIVEYYDFSRSIE